MPDPIDELENFSIPGLPMTPLPAAEVRRRGNRIRRRNNALATVGALAVIAAVATPFAIAAGGGGQTQQPLEPMTPPSGWTTTIPGDFDLGALPDGATFTFDVRDESVVDDFTLCGVPAFSTRSDDPAGPATDVEGAHFGESGSDGSTGRTLALYADADQAEAALDGLRDAVRECPQEEQPGNGLPLVNDPVDTPVAGAEDAFVWTNQAKDGELLLDLTAFEVVRVGNALYLANAQTSAGGQQAMGTVDNLLADSAPVVDQLCTFSVEGCPAEDESSAAVEEPTGLSGTIPDDFPLEKGLPTDQSGGAVGLEGPSPDLDLAVYNLENTLQACGVAPSGLPEPVDTLYAGYRSPAEGILRQLMTFGSTDDAQAYAEGLMAPFAACPEDIDEAGVSKVYEVTQEDLGEYAASSAMRFEVEGEPGPGHQVVQVVRVGQAVLLTVVNNDGVPLGTTTARTHLENSQTVVDEMN